MRIRSAFSRLRRRQNSIDFASARVNFSAWGNPKTGEIVQILTKEEVDAFVANPKKGVSKNCLAAYAAMTRWSDG